MEERNTRLYRQGELQHLTQVVTLISNMSSCKYIHSKIQVKWPPKHRMVLGTTEVIGKLSTCNWKEQRNNGSFVAYDICQAGA